MMFTLPRTGDDYPGGSDSDATGELLLEAGCGYFGNSMADDIPHYWITDYDRRHTLLMLPYYYAMDTQFFMFFPGVCKGSGLVQTRALWENWAAELEGVRRKYALPRDFVLMLGTVEPRHNQEVLFEALALLREREREMLETRGADIPERWKTIILFCII